MTITGAASSIGLTFALAAGAVQIPDLKAEQWVKFQMN